MKKDELVKKVCAKVIESEKIEKKDLEYISFCGRKTTYKQVTK